MTLTCGDGWGRAWTGGLSLPPIWCIFAGTDITNIAALRDLESSGQMAELGVGTGEVCCGFR